MGALYIYQIGAKELRKFQKKFWHSLGSLLLGITTIHGGVTRPNQSSAKIQLYEEREAQNAFISLKIAQVSRN